MARYPRGVGMKHQSLAPGLLLASPRLGDPNFDHTVVLLGHHDKNGALGWVINGQPLMPVSELLVSSGLWTRGQELPASPSFDRMARVGGPVDRATGWILYRQSHSAMANELSLGPNLTISGDSDSLQSVMAGQGPKEFRLLIGYSGWGPGQLEYEISEGAWLPASVDPALVFETANENVWQDAYKRSVGASPGAFVGGTRGQA